MRIVALLLAVCGIWIGVEVYLKGTENAFGGALASLGGSDGGAAETRDPRSVPRRAGDAVERAHAAAAARTERLTGD
jgi:hypothetical protein